MPGSQTLLVVDDNEANRDMLSRRLEKNGYSVLLAEDGRQALETLVKEKDKIDLVLLDIMMPGITGLDVLKALRETRSAAELPVIMVTAKSDSADVVEALDLGANDYVTKPLDFPVVLARVQAALRTKAARPQAPTFAEGPKSPGQVQPGTVLAGKYRLESSIGSGSFGTVYRARHLDLDHPVAVKVLQVSVSTDDEALTRFKREGISACRVRHPNAVTVLDFGVTAGGVAFLVLEMLEGHSLLDELNNQIFLSPDRCAEILIPVCDVLSVSHRAGVIHRDIKPSNIFLQRTLRGEIPKVLDFGIAKMAGDAVMGGHQTMAGTVLGTPAYMAPERFGGKPYDGKSDVYSLGVMLYQMLTGRLPFISQTLDPMEVAMMHQTQPPPNVREENPEVPEVVEAVVLQTLRKAPDQRPTAQELAWNLARAVGFVADADIPPGIEIPPPPSPIRGGTSDPATQVSLRRPSTMPARGVGDSPTSTGTTPMIESKDLLTPSPPGPGTLGGPADHSKPRGFDPGEE